MSLRNIEIHLQKSFWETTRSGVLCFDSDISITSLPKATIEGESIVFKPYPKEKFAAVSGYYIENEQIFFYLERTPLPLKFRGAKEKFYVAGEFNHWEWQNTFPMRLSKNKKAWILSVPIKNFADISAFKFVHASQTWLGPFSNSPNKVHDSNGNANFCLDLHKTGAHWIEFHSKKSFHLSEAPVLKWYGQDFPIDTLPWALQLCSEKPLGCHIRDEKTYFALFAPRAQKIAVRIFKEDWEQTYPLKMEADGVWSVEIAGHFEGAYYEFFVYTPEKQIVVDPYAHLLTSPQGPGIITTDESMPVHSFKTPNLQDLVILEGHVRDLSGGSTFEALSKQLQKNSYLKSLGINALELLPITEYDAYQSNEYHWGYMPAHFFAPSSFYKDPQKAENAVKELQKLVNVCHQEGIAVIFDVVYNHAGEFNSLQKIDKSYYFRTDGSNFSNCSGCGNDFRAEAPMAKRLIIDSLIHFLNVYGVDGFRFDLAELLGVEVLEEIAKRLKRIKPDVILIAEPWSFRGHAALALKGSDFSCWNDGFRDFLPRYVWGQGNTEGLIYFMAGSTAYLCENAQQTINYTESHDDFCWIDRITENDKHQGKSFTLKDRRRTHCMFSILLCSLGVPMIAAGQDFLKSKEGISNTYNRGDLNLMNYQRWEQFSSTHEYVKQLIRLRQSTYGKLFKVERPSSNYFKYFYAPNTSSLAILYNADHSLGPQQILFAVNPHDKAVIFHLNTIYKDNFMQIADTERVQLTGLTPPQTAWVGNQCTLPALSCAIWISRNV